MFTYDKKEILSIAQKLNDISSYFYIEDIKSIVLIYFSYDGIDFYYNKTEWKKQTILRYHYRNHTEHIFDIIIPDNDIKLMTIEDKLTYNLPSDFIVEPEVRNHLEHYYELYETIKTLDIKLQCDILTYMLRETVTYYQGKIEVTI